MTETSAGSSGCLTAKGLEISLAALKRQDPYINTIVDVASQVALYTYNNRENEWEKTEVEGTLFIYTRLASPKHGFTIMNRLSMENLTEPITKDLDFQLQHPFLLYRNARLVIHGIWFYDKEDCERVAQKMKILTQQEQALAQSQGGWLSPGGGRGEAGGGGGGSEGKGVDIIKMLTKARTEFDKGQSTSEPKEISGSSMLCGNPNLIKPIPVKPNTQDTEGAEPKPLSLATLFGTKQQHNQPHKKPHPVSPFAAPGAGTGSPSKATHPPVARALSYEGALNSGRVITSNEGTVITPEGPDRGVGALITGQTVGGDSGIVAVQQQQDQHQHCPAIQKLIQGPRGVGVALQTVPESPENRLFDNGLPLGHHHHHLIHHHHHLPQQQLHPDPIKRLFQTQPAPPPSFASFTTAAPQPRCSHPPPLQQQNPHLSSQPVAWSHLQEQQSRQHFVSLNKPLAEVQHGSQGAGLLPTQVTNDQVLQPPQALFAQMPGVVSPHELLQKLQLVQQEQNLVSHNAPRLGPGLAPRFLAPTQSQGPGSIVAPIVNPSAATAGQNASSQFQECNLNSVTFPQRIPATVAPVLLLSPSVFTQAKPSSGVSAEASRDSRVLSKSQLQASLLHLIQTDSSFLDTIYETYISRCVNDSSTKF
ncbi:mRNA-decapping enzyme 1B [Halichoeres trimaculatus]|uniref:mRNA-decapping enzyme 1B n=1 Tax=Halichoeres trimaculatus TaxID=147232 RepID=UPI003D9E2134